MQGKDKRPRRRASASSDESDHAAQGHRHARLERILREELEAVARGELSDPRLDGLRFPSVELSVDYRNARVRYAVPGVTRDAHEEKGRVERALARAMPFLRARLADSVELKQVPALRFVWAEAEEAQAEDGAFAEEVQEGR